jgi:hypothetical protein
VIRSGSTVERPRERGTRLGSRAKASEPSDGREPVRVDMEPAGTDPDGVLTTPGGRTASGETSD